MNTTTIRNIDPVLLREQIALVQRIQDANYDDRHELEGVLNLLDAVLDATEGATGPELTGAEQTRRGQMLVNILMLPRKRDNGRVDTAWGDKTDTGLFLTVKRIIERGE